jgi:tRNA (guanine-N7-)-methyltransferase
MVKPAAMDPSKPLRSYGRIKARALKPRQERLVETLLPRVAIDLAAPLPSRARAVLEIGFGGGEHLAAQARARPDILFFGVEPFLNGVGSCLRHIEESGVANVRVHMGDARDALTALPDACLERVYILFPDPWPKTRHHKRRLIQDEFIVSLARVVKQGGDVRFATDWADYAHWTLERFLRSAHFSWIAARADDWRTPWPDHVTTRYEEKKLGDCAPAFLEFVRR